MKPLRAWLLWSEGFNGSEDLCWSLKTSVSDTHTAGLSAIPASVTCPPVIYRIREIYPFHLPQLNKMLCTFNRTAQSMKAVWYFRSYRKVRSSNASVLVCLIIISNFGLVAPLQNKMWPTTDNSCEISPPAVWAMLEMSLIIAIVYLRHYAFLSHSLCHIYVEMCLFF